jgi:hypothetical protein
MYVQRCAASSLDQGGYTPVLMIAPARALGKLKTWLPESSASID